MELINEPIQSPLGSGHLHFIQICLERLKYSTCICSILRNQYNITYEITFLRQFHFIIYCLILSPNRNLETNRTKSVKERLKKSTWTPIVLSWTNRFLPSFFRWNRWNPQMNLLNHFLVKLKASNLLEMVWVTLQKKPLVHSTINFVQKRKMMF